MKRSTRLEVAERRKIMADLVLKGWTQSAIAAHLRVNQSTVARDLDEIRKQWRESALRDFDLAREQEIRKMDLVETEAWAGWLRSQGPIQGASLTEGAGGNRRVASLKHQFGNPRFLEQIIKCSIQRSALMGLVAVITDQAISLMSSFRPHGFVDKTNQFQELLADQISRQAKLRNLDTPIYHIKNTVAKIVRIRQLTSHLAQGRFRFKRNSPGANLLVQQLRDFPFGHYDDGPDALEMIMRLLRNMLQAQNSDPGFTVSFVRSI